MSIILHLPAETEALLVAQARAAGRDAESLVMDAIIEQLSKIEPTAEYVSTEEWLRLFDAWVNEHESRNPRLDDSRESIYPDR